MNQNTTDFLRDKYMQTRGDEEKNRMNENGDAIRKNSNIKISTKNDNG